MDDKTDGSTAMERLCRELMDDVNESPYASLHWCLTHVIDVETNASDIYGAARADIERRIAEARDEDLFKDDYMVRELKRMTGMHLDKDRCTTCGDVDEMVDAVEGWKAKAAELDALREACRIMPEGMRWPRYEDGEPVRMGDPFVAWDGQASEVRSVTLYAPGPDAAWAINAGSCRNFVGGSDEAHRMHGLRLKRPAPKAVGADGVEVKPGETVWLAEEYRDKALSTGPSHNLHYVAAMEEMTVSKVKNGRYFEVAWMYGEGSRWCPTSWLTHERPDSWERLREDAAKGAYEYWGCSAYLCSECNVKVGGKSQKERYGADSCRDAMKLDLVDRAERLAGVRGEYGN